MPGYSGQGILFVIPLVLLSLTTNSETQKDECSELVHNLIHKQIETIRSCMTKLNFTHGRERAAKMMCVIKCALIENKILDSEGKFDIAQGLAYMENEVPEVLKNRAMESFVDCQEYLGGIDPLEENCKTYEPVISCAQGAINNICVEPI